MMMNIEELRVQNKKLKELHTSCTDQLQKLKETGKNHEAEIDTLLKFNQRLLGIIENQFNSATKNKISSDLQIIAETNEASTDLSNHPMFKNKLTIQPPKLAAGGFEQQEMDGFQEEEDQEEIYNHERQRGQSVPVTPSVPSGNLNTGRSGHAVPPSVRVPVQAQQPVLMPPAANPKKITKLEKVFEMQKKGIEESINLGNSHQNSNASSSTMPLNGSHVNAEAQPQLSQLKEMIKQYKEEFVENSAEYEQICVIIHNDLLKDLEEFKKIRQESNQFYQEKMRSVGQLKQEIRKFRPVNELLRVMKKLNVPQNTERVLQQSIVSKHM